MVVEAEIVCVDLSVYAACGGELFELKDKND